MSLEELRTFLGWSCLLNVALLLVWFLMFAFARDWILKMHGKWFRLSEERFTEIHYQGIAFYKLGIFLFNLMPYLALRIMG